MGLPASFSDLKFFLSLGDIIQDICFPTVWKIESPFPILTPYQSVLQLTLGVSNGGDFTQGIGVNSVGRSDGTEAKGRLMKRQWRHKSLPALARGTQGRGQCCQTRQDARSGHR